MAVRVCIDAIERRKKHLNPYMELLKKSKLQNEFDYDLDKHLHHANMQIWTTHVGEKSFLKPHL